MEEDNRRAAEGFRAGVAHWDVERIGSLYDPEFTTEWPQSGAHVREYWGAPFQAPGWREPFVERMD